ncbi:MAG: hypothetical protein J6J35_04920, partial [Alphaproteobacteria bacterium]|nr:hypothetical protein [Alphaproteobacteria bacterium]
FAPILENMNNIDKKVLRDNKEYYEKSFKDTKYELDMAKIRIETLERENSELRTKLLYAETRLMQMEQSLLSQGATKEQIDWMIKQTVGTQAA